MKWDLTGQRLGGRGELAFLGSGGATGENCHIPSSSGPPGAVGGHVPHGHVSPRDASGHLTPEAQEVSCSDSVPPPPCLHPSLLLPWPRSPWSVGIVMPMWSCDRNRPTHQERCGAVLGRSPVLRQRPHPTVWSGSTRQHPPMGFHQNLGSTHVPTHTLSHTRCRKLPYLS